MILNLTLYLSPDQKMKMKWTHFFSYVSYVRYVSCPPTLLILSWCIRWDHGIWRRSCSRHARYLPWPWSRFLCHRILNLHPMQTKGSMKECSCLPLESSPRHTLWHHHTLKHCHKHFCLPGLVIFLYRSWLVPHWFCRLEAFCKECLTRPGLSYHQHG